VRSRPWIGRVIGRSIDDRSDAEGLSNTLPRLAQGGVRLRRSPPPLPRSLRVAIS
jgi:hypothetical protein